MHKFHHTIIALAAVTAFAAIALGQQTPPATTTKPAAPASKATTTKKAAAPAKKAEPTLSTSKDKFSYGLGMNLGTSLHQQSVPVDPELVLRGLKDGLNGGKTLMTEDEARAAIMQVQNELRAQQQEKAKVLGEANKKEGDAFLAANKAKDGVVTLPSGLQYKVLSAGTGPKPTATDSVVCNYRGTLINGTEFDSSYKRGQPATFPVNGVIKGWTEALQLMPVGSKWQLFVPSELAYGERGAGANIGPNAVLIFEVELMSIKEKEPEKAPDAAPQKAPETAPDKSAQPK